MRDRYRGCLIFCLLLFAGNSFVKAQHKDFQVWPSVQLGLQVTKKLNVNIEEEIRFKENCSQLDRQFNDLGVGYRFNKYLKASAYYRILTTWDDPDHNDWKQGFHGDLSLRYETGRFLFGYRTRFQSKRVALHENNERFFSELVNRHKVSVEYNIKNLPVTPFAEGELFFLLKNGDNDLTNYRGWIGLTYEPGNRHKFSLKYGFDRELYVEDPLTVYILAINYAFNFKL